MTIEFTPTIALILIVALLIVIGIISNFAYHFIVKTLRKIEKRRDE